MRSASISSEPIAAAMACAAPPVYASAPDRASHSACHAPAARSCSWAREAERTESYPCTSSAHARASVDETGLRLCGSVEEPPFAPSRSSPTSVCAMSTTSSPIFPSTPAVVASAAPSSAIRVRFVCHGRTGSSQPSSSARSRRTSGPRSPIAASVPTAPPSCTASRRVRTAASPLRDSSSATSQPATLNPNVVGSACCSSVRATIGVDRCDSASAARAAASPSSSASIRSSARRATSIEAVSMTSWLVAPQWT